MPWHLLKSRAALRVAVLLLLSPFIAGFSSVETDSLSHTISLNGGYASYRIVTGGCGQIPHVYQVPWMDASASYEHEIVKDFSVKIDAGGFQTKTVAGPDSTVSFPWLHHYFGKVSLQLEGQYVGAHIGLLGFYPGTSDLVRNRLEPTFRIRIGNRASWAFEMQFCEEEPARSGMFSVGFRFNLTGAHSDRAHNRSSEFWFGLGAIPYNGPVWIGHLAVPLSRSVFFDIGALGNGAEWGGSSGFSYSF